MASEYTIEVDGALSDTGEYALFSGGNDSLVATHVAMTDPETDVDRVLYLDTNSGLPENLDYVRETCAEYGWPLVVAKAPITLYEFATGEGPGDRGDFGFPGPGDHSWAFRYFKERQLGHIAGEHDDPPRYYTGVRSHESGRRMQTVDGEYDDRRERWVYINPIHDWRDERVTDYRDDHDLPVNPVADRIGGSGDCYCGSFESRTEELVELDAHYPGHAEWLRETEARVQEQLGTDTQYAYWGFGKLSKAELRALLAENDDAQMSLCSSCDIPEGWR